MQDIFLFADENSVAGIVAALGADHDVGLLSQHVDDFAFALIAPLGPDQNCIGHSSVGCGDNKNPRNVNSGPARTLFYAQTLKITAGTVNKQSSDASDVAPAMARSVPRRSARAAELRAADPA